MLACVAEQQKHLTVNRRLEIEDHRTKTKDRSSSGTVAEKSTKTKDHSSERRCRAMALNRRVLLLNQTYEPLYGSDLYLDLDVLRRNRYGL
jgi:hypothetical protein